MSKLTKMKNEEEYVCIDGFRVDDYMLGIYLDWQYVNDRKGYAEFLKDFADGKCNFSKEDLEAAQKRCAMRGKATRMKAYSKKYR